ncbi:hypothetical protein IAU60_001057 [Kwoniella sp. DSM 27419]
MISMTTAFALATLLAVSTTGQPTSQELTARQDPDYVKVTLTNPKDTRIVRINTDGQPDTHATSIGPGRIAFDFDAEWFKTLQSASWSSLEQRSYVTAQFYFDNLLAPYDHRPCFVNVYDTYRGWVTFDGDASGGFVVAGYPDVLPPADVEVRCDEPL